jgi:hypothetical protein
MKKILALVLLASSLSAFASTAKLIESCREAGTQKVISQAEGRGLKIYARDVKECGVDNRPLSIAKYVWFCAKVLGYDEIKVLTQKPIFEKCF